MRVHILVIMAILGLLVDKIGEAAAKELRTEEQGTFEDLQRLVNPLLPRAEDVVCQYREGERTRPCTASEFTQLTGAEFFNGMYATRESLVSYWQNLSRLELDAFFEVTVGDTENFPQLSFGKEREDAPQGYDVFVEEAVREGELVTSFGGELSVDSDSEYFLGCTDAGNRRNLGPMINDGFPNVAFVPQCQGGVVTSFVEAIGDLEAGDLVATDYGIDHFSKLYEPHIEGRPVALKAFVEGADLEQMFSQKLSGDLSKGESAQLLYLLATPSSWLYLTSEEKFPAQQILNILQQIEQLGERTENINQLLKERVKFAKECRNVQGVLSDQINPAKDLLSTTLKHWSGQFCAKSNYLFVL